MTNNGDDGKSDYSPTCFRKRLSVRNNKKDIRVELIAGLVREKGALDEYGVYIYCNNRLICKALQTPDVGFATKLAGKAHHTMCLARIFVKLYGASEDMPWTSNKAGIDYNHFIFQAIREDIIRLVDTYSKISKKLHPEFDKKVLPYDKGEIQEVRLQKKESIKPSRLPQIPKKSRQIYRNEVTELNKKLGEEKPWTTGLYEAIIAEKLIAKEKRLVHKNRISLILLDSTLEIAFKDYLDFEANINLREQDRLNLFRHRDRLQNKVKECYNSDNTFWNGVDYYHQLRNDLIHKKIDSGISDDMIERFRNFVIEFLEQAFGIQFPEE
jgi:hypothetical protein